MAVGKAAQESWLGELCTIGDWGRGVAAVSDQISGLRQKIPLIQTESENYTSYPFLKLFLKSRILVWGVKLLTSSVSHISKSSISKYGSIPR